MYTLYHCTIGQFDLSVHFFQCTLSTFTLHLPVGTGLQCKALSSIDIYWFSIVINSVLRSLSYNILPLHKNIEGFGFELLSGIEFFHHSIGIMALRYPSVIEVFSSLIQYFTFWGLSVMEFCSSQ